MEAEVITNFLPRLITAISDIVQPVSDQCLAKGLIPESVYKRVLESGGTSEDKARTLVLAIKTSTETDSRCLEILLTILEEKLPSTIRDNLLSKIRKEISEKANTCREVVPRSGKLVHVPSEEIPRETTAIHTQLLGRLEDSIRQHERACTEKNLLEQRLKAKSEKYEKLKHDLEALKSQTKEISTSIRDNMDQAQSRILACESKIMTLKTRIKELERVIEVQDMQARRGRETATTQTMNIFTQFAKQEIEKAVRMKEKEHKLEIHERDSRIRELEGKSSQSLNMVPLDILKPGQVATWTGNLTIVFSSKKTSEEWRKLGYHLGFTTEELDKVIIGCGSPLDRDKFSVVLQEWVRWYPGDSRGSTGFPSYTGLQNALVKAGFGEVIRYLPPYKKIY
jgi:DNA repair exonuclease SbcCD ATPase subunit